MRTAEKAWLALGAGVAAYEIACPSGETLSEGVDRMIEKHPILTLGTIAITAAHLMNLLPEKIDPFHRLTKLKKHSI